MGGEVHSVGYICLDLALKEETWLVCLYLFVVRFGRTNYAIIS